MARVKVQITKRASFQGKSNEWSNVYTYEVNSTSEGDMAALVSVVKNNEQTIHGSDVEFVRAAVWSLGWVSNTMIYTITWTNTWGSQIANQNMYQECAVLVQWPLPRSVSGGKSRYRALKKWYHTNHSHGYTLNGRQARGAFEISEPLPAAMVTLTSPGIAGAKLCNDGGETPTQAFQLGQYLEHRQFPRGRKEYTGVL